VGSLEKGKDGDVVIFNKHPLSIYAVPQYTIVDGIVRFDIKEDPADMRIDIDPEETVPSFYENNSGTHDHSDSCMQGVSEELLHNHKH